MLKKRYVVMGFLTFCLTIAFFTGATTSQVEPYDPWCDLDDNGCINIFDVAEVASLFGAIGTPINKTDLLLELQERIDSLNITLETRISQKGNISVPAAAFVPSYGGFDHRNLGSYLGNFETTGMATFYASVQLPPGATITNFTSCWHDNGDSYVLCSLYRISRTAITQLMAYAHSPLEGAPGNGSQSSETINHATVDNNEYAYFLSTNVPPYPDYKFYLAFIEYEYLP